MAYSVNIDNTSSISLEIFTFKTSDSASPDSYPDYVKVGEVAASSSGTYTPTESIENLYFVRQSDGIPLLNTVTELFSDTNVAVRDDDLTNATSAFEFYKAYTAHPDSEDASAINDILTSEASLTEMEDEINQYLSDSGYNFDYAEFTAISFWAQNDVRAWAQGEDLILYVYNTDNPSVEPSLIVINTAGKIAYQQFKAFEEGGNLSYNDAIALAYSRSKVTSSGATDTGGISLTSTVVDLADLGRSGGYQLFLTGTYDGDNIMAQSYQLDKNQTYSLEALCKRLGTGYPNGTPDIIIYDFYYSTSKGITYITGKVDITKVSFDDGVLDNVLTILSGTQYTFTVQLDVGVNLGAGTLLIKLDADDVKIPISSSSNLNLKNAEVMLSLNAVFKFVIFGIKSTLPFSLFEGQVIDADLSMTIDNLEAQVGVIVEGDQTTLVTPSVIKGVHIDEVGIAMGVFFKPPSLVTGVESKFHIGDSSDNVVTLDDDTFTVVCQIIDDVPNPLYISFYVPKLSLDEVLEIFTNKEVETGVPITCKDLSFTWMENPMEPVILPDGSLCSIAYGFSAFIDLFGLAFYGVLEIDLENGVKGEVTMSPYSVGGGLFALSGGGKGIEIKVDAEGNQIKNNYVPQTTDEQAAVDNATTKQLIKPGGPDMTVSTFSSPFFTLSAKLDFLEFSSAIDSKIGTGGITFDLDFGGVISSEMSCVLKDYKNFTGSFEFGPDWNITLPTVAGMSLGSIKLTAIIKATLSWSVSSSGVDFKVNGSFDFEGATRKAGPVSLATTIANLASVLKEIGNWIQKNVATVFNDLVSDAEKWAASVASGAITAAEDGVAYVTNVLKGAFNKTIDEVGDLLNQFNYGTDEVASALKSAFNPVANDLASALVSACNATEDAVSSALKKVGYGANDIASALKGTFSATQNEVAKDLKALGYGATAASDALVSAFNATQSQVTSALKSAGYTANQIAGALKSTFNATQKEVAKDLKAVGYSATVVSDALVSAYSATEDEVSDALKYAGYGANEIASALSKTFSATEDEVAKELKRLGYSADATASALESAFDASANEIDKAMKSVGYTSKEIEKALDDMGGDFEKYANKTYKEVEKYSNPNNW